VLGLLVARTQCYFGSCHARLKASLRPCLAGPKPKCHLTLGLQRRGSRPCLAGPKPKCHLTLGLQRRGSRPCATWRLCCPPSGGNPSATCPNMIFFIVIAVFKNLLMMIIIFTIQIIIFLVAIIWINIKIILFITPNIIIF